ncbi:hypothetical protein LTR53_016604 [Teratosphaeriaceae sp. CCFEE 6253]|nr:hypothetical protein LTR53_016604 [Teratosphaeriaceae sp. CCFEE 6253]
MLRALLQRVPLAERGDAINSAIASVGSNGELDVGLTLSLVHELPDEDARQALQTRLLTQLEPGTTDLVAAVTAHDAKLRDGLLREVSVRLCSHAGRLQRNGTRNTSVSMAGIVPLPDDESTIDVDDVEGPPGCTARAGHLLTFARSAISIDVASETFSRLCKAVLLLLGAAESALHIGARELLVKLFSFADRFSQAQHQLVWLCLQRLLDDEAGTLYQGLGFSVWLRWVFCESANLQLWFEPRWWTLIRRGLQHGDAERRKQCLAILRRSVIVAASDEPSIVTICAKQSGVSDRESIIAQYERFCTVFETILLGRYINQVVECERDLDTLSSPSSLVKAEWLYTLLVAALHPKMQDSNRKFIGNWIMRSTFQPHESDGAFVEVFRSAFLPWATQGHLFTATLHQTAEGLRCGHGDRLALYLQELLQRSVSDESLSSQLIDSVVNLLSARRTFAYAGVYLLEGLARALGGTTTMKMSTDQLETLASLASWAALPEVAQDLVYVRCLKLCEDGAAGNEEALQSMRVLKATQRWKQLQALLRSPRGAKLPAGPVATWDAQPSDRDTREDAALKDIRKLRADLAARCLDSDQSETRMLEIWTDVEYLEYPKRLLLEIPGLALDSTVTSLALESQSLAALIAKMVHTLQALSANRVYLLSPLLRALRDAILAVPAAVQFLDVEGVLLGYADRWPGPSIELQLEDATTNILQSVAPELEGFGYEYYFGFRQKQGAATLLDLTGRLGNACPEALESIFYKILLKWREQKVPPPTVSWWKSTLQLQLLLLCCEQILPRLAIDDVLGQLQHILSIEPLPRYRYLLSWMIARIYLRHESMRARLLSELETKDHHSNSKYLASLMKIGVMLVETSSASGPFALRLACAFVALSASSKVIIRHEAQWQVPQLMDVARARGWTEITQNVAFTALDDYIRSLARFEQPPPERQLDHFDLVHDHTLMHLVEGPWHGLDSNEALICGRADFVKLYERDAQSGHIWPSSCMPLGELSSSKVNADNVTDAVADLSMADPDPQAPAPVKSGESLALQTKGAAYMASAVAPDTSAQPERHELILVASLVDNPHNLGGLSRVSEVFGVAALALQNPNVTSNKDFRAVSVASHLHLPLLPLAAAAVPAYLATQRHAGWTIVGVEQTDRSVVLGSEACRLPGKVVLVLGSEREGIPALVLGQCDVLVEIAQRGVTRSLNVQTAAAIVLYEYARQRQAAGEGV